MGVMEISDLLSALEFFRDIFRHIGERIVGSLRKVMNARSSAVNGGKGGMSGTGRV